MGTTAQSAAGARRIGYSGKSVAAKLGLRADLRVRLIGAPPGYWKRVEFDPGTIELAPRGKRLDLVHWFVTRRAELSQRLGAAAGALKPDGSLWISWPKRGARVETDLSEDTIRALALPLGLVDVKVCAVDAVWSGLKLVWRRERRGGIKA
jgi:hypothetical protein